MLKNILSAFAGYAVWSVVFLGSSAGVRSIMSDVHTEDGMTRDVTALALYLAISAVSSFLGGLTTAKMAGEPKSKWVILLILLLLGTGIPVQLSTWDSLPLWYNLAFLILLAPITWVGGKKGIA
ncbi:MAG: hypothetical protein ACI841_004859 [Planctomycetota bacterium]|jgi:hypothetical protein